MRRCAKENGIEPPTDIAERQRIECSETTMRKVKSRGAPSIVAGRARGWGCGWHCEDLCRAPSATSWCSIGAHGQAQAKDLSGE